MDKKAKEFLNNLKKANAKDLKRRILDAAEKIIQEADLSKERLKEIYVDVSDFLQ